MSTLTELDKLRTIYVRTPTTDNEIAYHNELQRERAQTAQETIAFETARTMLRAMVVEEELYNRIGLALFLNSVGQLRNEGIYEYMRNTVNPNVSDAQIDAAIARHNAIFTHEGTNK